MKSLPKLLATAALVMSAVFPAAAFAATPVAVLTEGFDDLSGLSWTRINNSTPPGLFWFQGNPGIFAAQAGAVASYAGASAQSALHGTGVIDNWLITPQLSLLGPTALSFFTRTELNAPLFNDTLEIRFSTGGAAPADFTTLLRTVGGASPYPLDWQQFTANIDWEGTARFAFRYTGNATMANYIGIDTVSVTTVPEPSEYLMMLAGLAVLATLRRKQAQ